MNDLERHCYYLPHHESLTPQGFPGSLKNGWSSSSSCILGSRCSIRRRAASMLIRQPPWKRFVYFLEMTYILALPTVLEIVTFLSFSKPQMYFDTVLRCMLVFVAISSIDKSFGYSFSRHSRIFCSASLVMICTDAHYYRTRLICLVVY